MCLGISPVGRDIGCQGIDFPIEVRLKPVDFFPKHLLTFHHESQLVLEVLSLHAEPALIVDGLRVEFAAEGLGLRDDLSVEGLGQRVDLSAEGLGLCC